MKDVQAKKSVLKEIIDMMDDREREGLKKHPKLMTAEAEVETPEAEPEEKESDSVGEAKSEIDPEDLERLMELHRSLKG